MYQPLSLVDIWRVLDALGAHVGCQVPEAGGITPLVVVPTKHFDHVAIHDHGGRGIDNTTCWIPSEIRANQFFLAK